MKIEHMSKYKQLGLKIAYYRKMKGYTQDELAEKLDINAAFLGHVEAPNIDKAISLDTVLHIADLLDVPRDKLLDFDGS